MNIALIIAGGTGKRYNPDSRPKQFLHLQGKAIIVHSIEPFQAHPEVDCICVVCLANWIDHFNMLKEKYHLTKVRWVVEGGDTNQKSVYRGLCAIRAAISEDINPVVVTHDGVRPIIDLDLISRCIDSVKQYGSAVTVAAVAETVVTVDDSGIISGTVERSTCRFAKTPNCFYLDDILRVQEMAMREGNTSAIDSPSLMIQYGKKLHAVQGSTENIKITTPVDYFLYKAIFEARESAEVFGI